MQRAAAASASSAFSPLPRPDVQVDQRPDTAPLDSAAQDAIIESFWRDKAQQDRSWQVILLLTAAALLALLSSLWWSPHYSPLHSAFTLQMTAYLASSAPTAIPLALLLLVVSVLCSASLSLLLSSSRAPSKERVTATWPVRVAAVVVLGVVALPLVSSVHPARLTFYGCLPFLLCCLYFLMAVYAAHSSDRLARQVRQLSKARYQFHEL